MRTISKLHLTLIVAVLSIGIALATFAISRGNGNPAESLQYTVATVTRGDIVRSVRSTGQITPLVSVEVSTQISGLVTELTVDFNSVVKKGQVLARIDSSNYEQRLRQTRADLEAAQAAHTLALSNAQRLRGLVSDDIVSRQEYDQIETTLQQTEAILLARRAAVENARVDLERCTITAPIDGIVIYKQVEVGKTVVSSLNAPTLLTIAQDLSAMRIVAQVSEVDIWLVQPGQEVSFTIDALPQREFHGRVTQIRNPYTPSDKQPLQQSQVTSFDTVVEVDNRALILRPGLTANVTITVDRHTAVLQIPNTALRVDVPGSRRGDVSVNTRASISSDSARATVYRIAANDLNAVPEPVAVQLGLSDSFASEIVDGLNEGDIVITGIRTPPEESTRSGVLGF